MSRLKKRVYESALAFIRKFSLSQGFGQAALIIIILMLMSLLPASIGQALLELAPDLGPTLL